MEAVAEGVGVMTEVMGVAEVSYPDGREIAPEVDLREWWGLFDGVRPFRAIPGAPRWLADPRAGGIDFVLVREQTEGLFAARGKTEQTDEEARDVQVITRPACERLFDFCFKIGRAHV